MSFITMFSSGHLPCTSGKLTNNYKFHVSSDYEEIANDQSALLDKLCWTKLAVLRQYITRFINENSPEDHNTFRNLVVDDFDFSPLLKLPEDSSRQCVDHSKIVPISQVHPHIEREASNLGLLSWSVDKLEKWLVKYVIQSSFETNYALDLSKSRISATSFHLISQAFIHNSILKHCISSLQLSNMNLDDTAVSSLAFALSNNDSITSLDIHRNEVTSAGVEALCSVICKFDSLQILNLSENPIGDSGCDFLTNALSAARNRNSNPGIISLQLYHCRFSTQPALNLLREVVQSSQFKHIEIGMVFLGDEAIRILNDLPNNSKLDSISLPDCGISDKSLHHLQVFSNNIVSVDFRNNRLSFESVRMLSQALQSQSILQSLLLSGNNIDDRAEMYLLHLIESNPGLLHMEIDNTKISPPIVKKLSNLLSQRRSDGRVMQPC